MNTYIAILRGINVSGHNMIKMAELTTMFECLHLKSVKTYIQSGNVVFKHANTKVEELEKKISKGIAEQFGFQVPVLVIEKNELLTTLENNPFVNERKEDVSKLHVTFLAKEPDDINTNKINKDQYLPDEFILSGRVIYLFCPTGYGNTKLNNNFFENKLKAVATTRNWKTVNELASIAKSL